MRIILNEADTEHALDHLEELVDQIRDEHRTLRGRHLQDKDGHRDRASGADHGGGGASNELDDDGTPLAPRSDPTASVVINRNEPTDEVGLALATVVGKIHQLARLAESIVSDAAQVRPPIKPKKTDDIWCNNCKKHGVHEPRAEQRTICAWCRDEQHQHKKLPGRRLVLTHARGMRITPKLRAEIAQRDKEDRAKAKAAKKAAKSRA